MVLAWRQALRMAFYTFTLGWPTSGFRSCFTQKTTRTRRSKIYQLRHRQTDMASARQYKKFVKNKIALFWVSSH
ncbi:hypothetical protein GGS24DRAFT_288009 [Hypoxylon argillaceum]|nr:hypothetical protein GGS24DRAFT_288009 [Hypoxylon argillaceum]